MDESLVRREEKKNSPRKDKIIKINVYTKSMPRKLNKLKSSLIN